ncbi:MAG TPA: hypothetical protein VEQ11_01175 [Chloroflexota bacterium]|nr:hypothetical protein [Chloroflexota bacterium]
MAPSSPPSQQPPSDDSPAGPGIASPAQTITLPAPSANLPPISDEQRRRLEAATDRANRPESPVPDDPLAPRLAGTPAVPETAPGSNLQIDIAPDGRPMRAGSLLVKFRSGADQAAREAAHQAVGALLVQPLGLSDTVRVEVPPEATAQALTSYRARPDVEYAEPDYIVRVGSPGQEACGDQ